MRRSFYGLGAEGDFPQLSVLAVQRALRARGFNPGALDGIWGPRTEQALIAAMERTTVFGGYDAAEDRRTVRIADFAWNAILALPASQTSTGGGGTSTGGGVVPSGGGSTTGPMLDLSTAQPEEPSGVNWPLIIGAGVVAFGLGWFVLGKKTPAGTAGLGRARRRRRSR
jgi:peptidoglycan hydrolase-like protein with peptidoglycan-binding domain